MLRDLDYLMQLQEIDLRIFEQERAKEELPATVKEYEGAIIKANVNRETAIAAAAETEKEILALDEQVLQAQRGLEKSQGRLNAIKTNREYDAVHAEIESQKNIVASSEARKKKLTDEAARRTAEAETAAQEFEKVKGENGPKIDELKAKIASIDSVIAAITREREGVTPHINKAILRTYELIRKRRKGRVISRVTDTRTCSVCFKVLESQLMNEIKRSSKLILCQNCGSIFVWIDAQKSPEQA